MNFKLLKIMSLFLVGFVPGVAMILALVVFLDVLLTIIFYFGSFGVMFLISYFILSQNPFIAVIEKKGILGITLDSKGILQPFLIKIRGPLMEAKLGKQKLMTNFDRNLLFFMRPPKKAWAWITKSQSINSAGVSGEVEETINFSMPRNDYDKNVFSLNQMPVIFYNSVKELWISKEMLIEMESKLLAHHLLVYLLRKTEEFNSLLRDFVRYIMEQLRPKKNIFASMGFWLMIIIICVAFGIMAIMFGPEIMKMFSGSGGIIAPVIQPRG